MKATIEQGNRIFWGLRGLLNKKDRNYTLEALCSIETMQQTDWELSNRGNILQGKYIVGKIYCRQKILQAKYIVRKIYIVMKLYYCRENLLLGKYIVGRLSSGEDKWKNIVNSLR